MVLFPLELLKRCPHQIGVVYATRQAEHGDRIHVQRIRRHVEQPMSLFAALQNWSNAFFDKPQSLASVIGGTIYFRRNSPNTTRTCCSISSSHNSPNSLSFSPATISRMCFLTIIILTCPIGAVECTNRILPEKRTGAKTTSAIQFFFNLVRSDWSSGEKNRSPDTTIEYGSRQLDRPFGP